MKYILHIVLVFMLFSANAQTAHFSQFYGIPMNLNPALTGVFNGKLRTAANFRNQWSSLGTPYRTYSAAVDYRITSQALKRDFMGTGLSFYNDVTGGTAKYRNQRIALNAAMGKNFSTKKMTNILVVGFQAGVNLSSIDNAGLTYGSQFVNDRYDATVSSGEEPFKRNQFSYDYSLGGFYVNENRDGMQTTIGASYFHFNQPDITLGRSGEDKMSPRLNIHGSYQFKFGSDMKIMPLFLYANQGKTSTVTTGMIVNIAEMNKRTNTEKQAFYFGLMIRSLDAIILTAGGSMKGAKMGISYDVNLSPLSAGTNFAGGPEIFLQYVLSGKRGNTRVTIPSLRI